LIGFWEIDSFILEKENIGKRAERHVAELDWE